MEQFIHPYQFNYIRGQLNQLLQTVYFAGDYRVYAAHKLSVRENVLSMFPELDPAFKSKLFQGMEEVKGKRETEAFMQRLEPYIIPFPVVGRHDIRELFPKVKKLALPDFTDVNWSNLSYFGWRDIGMNTLFLVARHNGSLIGLRSRITLSNRPGVCSVCNHSGTDVGLAVTVTKASNYKTVGNHICLNSQTCNRAMTSLSGLQALLEQAQRQT